MKIIVGIISVTILAVVIGSFTMSKHSEVARSAPTQQAVDCSVIEKQAAYALVDHRWKRSRTFLRDLLEQGVLTPEIDVRFDKDMTPWILHGPGTDGGFFPPFVRNTSTEKMASIDKAMPLEEALAIFGAYNDGKHHLIIEIKELGDRKSDPAIAMGIIAQLIKNASVQDAISLSSISPALLMTAHEVMPDAALILNYGPTPFIDDANLKRFSEKLPSELLEVLRAQHAVGKPYGGIITLSPVTWAACMLDVLHLDKNASALRQRYAKGMEQLGVGIMATTYFQRFGDRKKGHPLNPAVQTLKIKRDLGDDTVVYTTDPQLWAGELP